MSDLVTLKFNTPSMAQRVEPIDMLAIKATCGLWHADLDDALRYGGEVTRHVLGCMALRGDRKNIVVDTKVHMLLPGFMPAIPGWHTDGVPRFDGEHWGPETGEPSLAEQAAWEESGEDIAPRYHLYVSGSGCLTQFVTELLELELPAKGADTYVKMTKAVDAIDPATVTFPDQVVEWDWWTIHTAQPAAAREWRFLCRVTETDHMAPETDLRQVIRTQEQVYVAQEFGW